MYDSYPSKGSMKEEDWLVDAHDDNVVNDVQEIMEKIQDDIDTFDFLIDVHGTMDLQGQPFHFKKEAKVTFCFHHSTSCWYAAYTFLL